MDEYFDQGTTSTRTGSVVAGDVLLPGQVLRPAEGRVLLPCGTTRRSPTRPARPTKLGEELDHGAGNRGPAKGEQRTAERCMAFGGARAPDWARTTRTAVPAFRRTSKRTPTIQRHRGRRRLLKRVLRHTGGNQGPPVRPGHLPEVQGHADRGDPGHLGQQARRFLPVGPENTIARTSARTPRLFKYGVIGIPYLPGRHPALPQRQPGTTRSAPTAPIRRKRPNL